MTHIQDLTSYLYLIYDCKQRVSVLKAIDAMIEAFDAEPNPHIQEWLKIKEYYTYTAIAKSTPLYDSCLDIFNKIIKTVG